MSDFPEADGEGRYDPNAPPRVGSNPSLWPVVAGVLGALGLGSLVFMQLSANRARIEVARLTDPAPDAAPISNEGVPPPPPITYEPPPEPITYQPEPPPPAASTTPATAPEPGMSQAEIDRLRAPALIVDLSEFKPPETQEQLPGAPLDARNVAGAIASGGGAAGLPAGMSPEAVANLNPDERFASRLGAGTMNKPSVASSRINLGHTIVEGAVIPAVLETPINSDLPGYVRAVVSRDMRGFDGSKVLVPRGSRLIGQYRSGVALGQSRAFVIWTRLIRPDGAAVELASPSTDALGQGGLDGDVDRHFLQRFGGAILLSLISFGATAAADSSDTSIVIASTRAGSDAAGVALSRDIDIPPTVTVPQGAPVRVFVSQDLDFSAVGSAVQAADPSLP